MKPSITHDPNSTGCRAVSGVPMSAVAVDLVSQPLDKTYFAPVIEACRRHDLLIATSTQEKVPQLPGVYFHTGFVMGPQGLVLRSPKSQAQSAPEVSYLRDLQKDYVRIFGPDSILPVADTKLGKVANLTHEEAREAYMAEVRVESEHDANALSQKILDEAERSARDRAREITLMAIQRFAAENVGDSTVRTIKIPSDDMKGRIIGREGRNIRALENLTGVDFIIDDTPHAVVLSGFDGVRREVARMTLEKLLQDGRIHPARIEETYYQAKSELDTVLEQAGEQAVFDANVQGLDPELAKLLGRLKFRTSYGQNVLAHSVECAQLASLMADELGASAKTARRAALLHDIGKAVSHEVEGPHALVGGDLARRHGESEAVAHAMEAHHNEVEPQTVEAVIVQAADALSGARPGARGPPGLRAG